MFEALVIKRQDHAQFNLEMSSTSSFIASSSILSDLHKNNPNESASIVLDLKCKCLVYEGSTSA